MEELQPQEETIAAEAETRPEVDEPEGGLLFSESAFIIAIAKLLWMYSFALAFCALIYCVYLTFKRVIMWKVALYTQDLSPLDMSILVGSDIGFITVIVWLVFLVPRMIMTWTAAIVFEFLFEKKLHRSPSVIENGKKLATEICFSTIRDALRGGKFAAMVACLATLLGLTLFKPYVRQRALDTGY